MSILNDINIDKMNKVCYNDNVSVRTSEGLTMIEMTNDAAELMKAFGKGGLYVLFAGSSISFVGWVIDWITYNPIWEAKNILTRK